MKKYRVSSRMSRDEHAYMKRLHRAVVMVRHGAGLVENKWYGACSWCGNERWLQCCHIEPVGRCPHMRYDPDNAFAGCYYCHLHKWHKSPREAEEFIVKRIGAGPRKALATRATTKTKPDLAAIRLALELEWKKKTGSLKVP